MEEINEAEPTLADSSPDEWAREAVVSLLTGKYADVFSTSEANAVAELLLKV